MDLSAKPEKKSDLSLHFHNFFWESNNDLGTTENSCLVKSSATSNSGLVLEITTTSSSVLFLLVVIRSDLRPFTFICLLVLLNVINFRLGRVS